MTHMQSAVTNSSNNEKKIIKYFKTLAHLKIANRNIKNTNLNEYLSL